MEQAVEIQESREDIEWVDNFCALNALFKTCKNSESSALLLSTCRNAYMTINALFVELQGLMGTAQSASPLRSGSEILIRGNDPSKAKDQFGRAIQWIREYEKKRTVWNNRDQVWKDIVGAIEQIKLKRYTDASRILRLIKDQSQHAYACDGWSLEVTAFNLEERPHLGPDFSAVDDVYRILRCATELGFSVANFLSFTRQEQPELWDKKDKLTEIAPFGKITQFILDLARMAGWQVAEAKGRITVSILKTRNRPSSIEAISKIEIDSPICEKNVEKSAPLIGHVVREALYLSHAKMCQDFKPNMSDQPPMPPPFEISLSKPVPSLKKGIQSRSKLVRINCSNSMPTDCISVAIGELCVPYATCFDGKNFRLKSEIKDFVAQDFLCAIEKAKSEQCNAIIFPEYSVPASLHGDLLTLSAKYELVIVAGQDGQWQQGMLSDRAVIAIPGEQRLHYQYKQEPCLDEVERSSFYSDGERKIFLNSIIGDFSIVMCSDFMQLSTFLDWGPDGNVPETVFIIARNTYNDLYVSLAKADSLRLYAAVVIANVCDDGERATSDGSCVVVPKRDDQLLEARKVEVAGRYLRSISIYDIPLYAIRARNRGKPTSGYFAVPHSAMRV